MINYIIHCVKLIVIYIVLKYFTINYNSINYTTVRSFKINIIIN